MRAPPLGCKPTDLVVLSCDRASDARALDLRPHALGLVKRLKVRACAQPPPAVHRLPLCQEESVPPARSATHTASQTWVPLAL